MTSSNGTKTTAIEGQVKLRRLERSTIEIPIRGTAPLIANRWSEKAKEMLLTAMQSSARAKKPPKDPVGTYEAARYRLPDGRDGFPAVAFKAAIVSAAREFEGVTLVALKTSIFVKGELAGQHQLVPLTYGDLSMREDPVRNASGVADLRYRPMYHPWSATLYVQTIVGKFDIESLFALVDAAGIGGVGEWRPSAPKSYTGTFGTFEVAE